MIFRIARLFGASPAAKPHDEKYGAFTAQGKACGDVERAEAIQRGALMILADATLADMKAKRARDKARDEAARQAEAVKAGEQTDWQEAMQQWQQWEESEAAKD